MNGNNIVQFVFFETILSPEQFVPQWMQYSKQAGHDSNIILQHTSNKGHFRYISQHPSQGNGFKFTFDKTRKKSPLPEISVRVKQAGGYSLVEPADHTKCGSGEVKLLVFLMKHSNDIEKLKEIKSIRHINVYEPFYENCQYEMILEIFASRKHAEELLKTLQDAYMADTAIYSVCSTSSKAMIKQMPLVRV
ncbi:MAG: hypothetical protein V9E88_15945 [Ferruginibacter sp.]